MRALTWSDGPYHRWRLLPVTPLLNSDPFSCQTKTKQTNDRSVEKAAELKYTELPRLQERYAAKLEDVKKSGSAMLQDWVGPEQVAAVVSRWTGIPVSKLNQGERDRVLGLEDRLKKQVIGQDPAVKAVADAIIRARAGLAACTRPIGSFLFLGPTGVGKTHVSKQLAQELFDDDKNMVRTEVRGIVRAPPI